MARLYAISKYKLTICAFLMLTIDLMVLIYQDHNPNYKEISENTNSNKRNIHQIQQNYSNFARNHIKTENTQNEISIKDYMRFYKLDANKYYMCNRDIRRPDPYTDIVWHKNTYQHMQFKFKSAKHGEFPTNDAYAMKFYFDDRFVSVSAERYIRAIISINAPGFLPKQNAKNRTVLYWAWARMEAPWQALFWYEGFQQPIGVKCYISGAGGLTRQANGTHYDQHFVNCPVPEINMLPVQASIVNSPCFQKPSNLIEVVYPEPTTDLQTIGVCMASLYGKLSEEDVPYFVNWMETLHVLGVGHVSMNNASLSFSDDVIRSAFAYYSDIGWLTMTHYPPIVNHWESPKEDDAATEGINKMATGDCVYRNLKKYWYVLIIDMDEIPVPTNHKTYQEFLHDYISRHPNLTMAHSLAIRSSFYYTTMAPGNLEYGKHLPILRLTNHHRIEPFEVDGVGLSKSFHNMRNIVSAGHHLVRVTHPKWDKLIHHFLPAEEIVIHHYRKLCKWDSFCAEHWNETQHDDILPKKYGFEVQTAVEKVLTIIGYAY